MQKLSIKNIILVATVAFGVGLLSPHISSWLTATPLLNAPVEIKEDHEPIATDEFTLRLLKAATIVHPSGNIILAPDSLATTLLQMIPLASPEVEKALQDLGADRCIYVGDTQIDVETARNANAPCVCVLWGFRDRHQLEAVGAEHFCTDAAQLLPTLEKIMKG